jgi:hypothetical protein
MKRLTGIAAMLVLLATPMFGANNKPRTIVITENVQVGTTKIPAGTYKLAWTAGTGQEVQATLSQGAKTVATFAAKAVTTKNDSAGVSVDTKTGSTQLREILLQNLDLQVEGESQPIAAGGGSL